MTPPPPWTGVNAVDGWNTWNSQSRAGEVALIWGASLTCTAHVGSVAADDLSAAQRSGRGPPSSTPILETVPYLTCCSPPTPL